MLGKGELRLYPFMRSEPVAFGLAKEVFQMSSGTSPVAWWLMEEAIVCATQNAVAIRRGWSIAAGYLSSCGGKGGNYEDVKIWRLGSCAFEIDFGQDHLEFHIFRSESEAARHPVCLKSTDFRDNPKQEGTKRG